MANSKNNLPTSKVIQTRTFIEISEKDQWVNDYVYQRLGETENERFRAQLQEDKELQSLYQEEIQLKQNIQSNLHAVMPSEASIALLQARLKSLSLSH